MILFSDCFKLKWKIPQCFASVYDSVSDCWWCALNQTLPIFLLSQVMKSWVKETSSHWMLMFPWCHSNMIGNDWTIFKVVPPLECILFCYIRHLSKHLVDLISHICTSYVLKIKSYKIWLNLNCPLLIPTFKAWRDLGISSRHNASNILNEHLPFDYFFDRTLKLFIHFAMLCMCKLAFQLSHSCWALSISCCYSFHMNIYLSVCIFFMLNLSNCQHV